MKINAAIRSARTQDIAACAAIVNSWIDETDWMPRFHSVEDVVQHYRNVVYRNCKIFVVASNSAVMGFAAFDKNSTIAALYVDGRYRGQGIGHLLMDKAKGEFKEFVQLWTFQKNVEAQRFYKREGFEIIHQTDGDNDEQLPDYLMEWRG